MMINADNARMGQFVKTQKQMLNLNTLIHGMAGAREAFNVHKELINSPGKYFPDVSFYQKVIDWNQFKTLSDAVIIRAGQNLWIDEQFVRNWSEAKARDILRGTYWFYDDRISPGKQADLWISLLAKDKPEMECWLDWENSYGGAYGGLKNVVAMMERVEAAGFKVGLYTGYYWFTGNSNPVTNAAHYAYLKTHPLWLAWYTSNPSYVKIPNPWVDLWLWQYGTPSVGATYGVETVEIDMNAFNGSEDQFYYFYGQALPDQGETMDKYMTTSPALTLYLNIRSSGTNLGNDNDLGDFNMLPGDVIHVVESNAMNYVRFDALYRKGVPVTMPTSPTGQYWALATNWLMDTTFTPPKPSIFITHTFTDTLTYNGVTYTGNFTVNDVEYKPNP